MSEVNKSVAKALSQIADALANIAVLISEPDTQPAPVADAAPAKEAPKRGRKPSPPKTPLEADPEPDTKPAAPDVSLSDIRERIKKLSADPATDQDSLKEILSKYAVGKGVARISELPDGTDFSDLLGKLAGVTRIEPNSEDVDDLLA